MRVTSYQLRNIEISTSPVPAAATTSLTIHLSLTPLGSPGLVIGTWRPSRWRKRRPHWGGSRGVRGRRGRHDRSLRCVRPGDSAAGDKENLAGVQTPHTLDKSRHQAEVVPRTASRSSSRSSRMIQLSRHRPGHAQALGRTIRIRLALDGLGLNRISIGSSERWLDHEPRRLQSVGGSVSRLVDVCSWPTLVIAAQVECRFTLRS